jgi:hypothetical protein
MFLAVAGSIMLVHVADIEAAPQKLAFAGTFITESVEVMGMPAFLAFLEAEAILAANITVCICKSRHVLGAAARTVLKDHTRLAALLADSITVRHLTAVAAQLFNDALLAILLMALVKDLFCMLAALVVLADHFADDIHAAMMVIHASTFFRHVQSLIGIAFRMGGRYGQSAREQGQGHQYEC